MSRMKEARALLERAMWAVAETDDEDFRAEIEVFLLNTKPFKKYCKTLKFVKHEDPCGFGHE